MNLRPCSRSFAAAVMLAALLVVLWGKALDLHWGTVPLTEAQSRSESGTVVSEYCFVCHFHLAACTLTLDAVWCAVREAFPCLFALLSAEEVTVPAAAHDLRAPPAVRG